MRHARTLIIAPLLAVTLAVGTTDAAQFVRTRRVDEATRVRAWYERYLGRAPDPGAMQGWVDQLSRGGNVEASILGSDEYFARHGNDYPSFVAGLYVEVLLRQPSPEEVNGWLTRLQQSGYNRTQMADEFLQASQIEFATRRLPAAAPPAYLPPLQPNYVAPPPAYRWGYHPYYRQYR